MKKRRLKKWVKVFITIILLLFSMWMYSKCGILGQMAQSNGFYEALVIMAWVWLLFGPVSVLMLLWEEVKK